MNTRAISAPAPAIPAIDTPAIKGRVAREADNSWVSAVRHSLTLIAFSAFLLTALWVAIVLQIHREAKEAVRNAEVELTNLTRAFSEHSSKTIEAADQALRFVRSEYADHRKGLDIGAYLKQKAIIDSAFHLISIIDADGFVSNSSQPFQRVDLRDREHFRVHAQGTEDRLFISKPVLGRVSKKWSIQMTRRLSAPDGGFDGVVVLSLSPDYLTRFYGDVDLGRHGAITLVGYDGVVRARATRDNAEGAQDLSANPLFRYAMQRKSGTLIATSGIDHVERIWAFRALDEYGVLVFTGMGTTDVMADSRERRTSYLIGATLMTVVIIGFVGGLVRRARQQLMLLAQLKLSNQRAQAANQMKSRFLASVSHELRTPLNGILGYAELIQDTAPDAESREFGQIIHQSAKHLHSLVNTILDLAKIESGRMTLNLAPLHLATLLGDACALSAMHAQARGLVLSLDVQAGCPETITTDATRLTQVLHNLIGNAIKFTDGGSVTITARGQGGDVVIEVVDTGVGIPDVVLASVYTRFHATTTDFVHPAQGAGLGLPLAHELTELLGGTMTIETSNKGTTLILRLPASGPAARTEVET